MYSSAKDLIIKPDQRYTPKDDYPHHLIMVHHPEYFELAQELLFEMSGLTIDDGWEYATHYRKRFWYKNMAFVLDNARDNAVDSMRHVLQNYFWGIKTIINIGAAGGIDRRFKVGSYVVGKGAVRGSGVDSNLATADEEVGSSDVVVTALKKAFADISPETVLNEGDSWTVGNMYYSWDDLDAVIDLDSRKVVMVETEMAPICTMAEWANRNYRSLLGYELEVGNLFYISDILPLPDQPWVDTLNEASGLRDYKKQVLRVAISAIESLQ